MKQWSLRVEQLGKSYPLPLDAAHPGGPRELAAARDVSFDLSEGEALGLVGASGSGKSSVMRCLAGDQPASSGTAYLSSFDEGRRDILGLDPAARRGLRRGHLAVVYQNPADGLNMSLTAGANIARPLLAAGERNFDSLRRQVRSLLARVDIAPDRADDPTSSFSGGMRQRVQLAAALASAPRVLLLDEPTTGLDAASAASVLDLIRDLLDELAVSSVVVSHDFAVIELLCTRTLVLKEGRIIEQALTDQLLEDPQDPYSQDLVAAARA